MHDSAYTLSELCDLADVTPRTVRYYIAQGLLRSPGASGPGARYDDGHLARLRLIRRLQREHLPLADIRARLAALTDDEVIAEAEVSAPADSALDYVRSVLATPLRVAKPAPPPAASPPPGTSTPGPACCDGSPRFRCRATTRNRSHPPPTAPTGSATPSPRTSSCTSGGPSRAARTAP